MTPPGNPSSSALSEPELVAAANRGESSALEELYRRHRDWVYALAARFAGNEEDAADATQEVFLYLFGKFPGLELTCQLRTLLFPAVRNVAVRLRQKRARARPLAEAAEPAAPEPGGAGDIADLVAGLPDEQRELVLLRFSRDLSLEEIARELGLPLGTVKSRLHRALQSLRERLGG
jgi:RNA polymerase sigma-70 factor (ECF subfamily)